MELFKNWVISLCGAGIITSLFSILISNSKLKKSINVFLSMFYFLYAVIPIENITNNFDINLNDNNLEKSYSEIYKEGYESIVIESVKSICKENDATISLINIESYINEEYVLIINKIELRLSDDSKNQVIQNELNSKLNFEVTFI